MNLPQIIYVAINLTSFGIILARNGQPREDNYNAGITFVALLIDFGLLWWGGFFND